MVTRQTQKKNEKKGYCLWANIAFVGPQVTPPPTSFSPSL